jgi:hypothetical protein
METILIRLMLILIGLALLCFLLGDLILIGMRKGSWYRVAALTVIAAVVVAVCMIAVFTTVASVGAWRGI